MEEYLRYLVSSSSRKKKFMEIDDLAKEFERLYPNPYDGGHAIRFAYSYETIKHLLTPGVNVLEMGGAGDGVGAFNDFISKKHGIKVDASVKDLRHPLSHLKSDHYDLILNMEVLEHIKDKEDGTFHCFDFGGVNTFLSECLRVLKPGGTMFLTTPNAHNLTNLVRILELNTPMFYRPHVREYGARETADMLTQAGFRVTTLKTINVWQELTQEKFTWLRDIALSCGSDVSMMNNDTFILATK